MAGYTGRALAMAGGIIGIAALAAYFGIAHVGEPNQGGGSIAGQVQIAPNLADQVKPTDVLFVIVRRPAGPPRPIAAKRIDGPKFPVQFEITNADVMVQGSELKGMVDVFTAWFWMGKPASRNREIWRGATKKSDVTGREKT